MSVEDEGIRGVGSDEEMVLKRGNENQVRKGKSMGDTREQRITAESDVVDNVAQRYVWL
jgi:hypothetical protein